jgi:purine nucleosidase
MLQAYAHVDPLLHDACPVAALIDPTLFGGEPRRLRVEWRDPVTEGRLVTAPVDDAAGTGSSSDWGQGRLITTVDNERLLALVHDAVASLPRQGAAA